MIRTYSLKRATFAAVTIALLFFISGGFRAHAAMIYWTIFNQEDNPNTGASFVTYATLNDMLFDANRLDSVFPLGGGFPERVVGSGAFFVPDMPVVPLPATIWMFLTALGGFVLFGWRRKGATA